MGLSPSHLGHLVLWADECEHASQDAVRSILQKIGVEWTEEYCEKFEVYAIAICVPVCPADVFFNYTAYLYRQCRKAVSWFVQRS